MQVNLTNISVLNNCNKIFTNKILLYRRNFKNLVRFLLYKTKWMSKTL